jgi:hypothetical protein
MKLQVQKTFSSATGIGASLKKRYQYEMRWLKAVGQEAYGFCERGYWASQRILMVSIDYTEFRSS